MRIPSDFLRKTPLRISMPIVADNSKQDTKNDKKEMQLFVGPFKAHLQEVREKEAAIWVNNRIYQFSQIPFLLAVAKYDPDQHHLVCFIDRQLQMETVDWFFELLESSKVQHLSIAGKKEELLSNLQDIEHIDIQLAELDTSVPDQSLEEWLNQQK